MFKLGQLHAFENSKSRQNLNHKISMYTKYIIGQISIFKMKEREILKLKLA